MALGACGGSDDDDGDTAATTTPEIQTISFQEPEDPGEDPFTPPADVEGSTTVEAQQPFGGSGSNRVCDRDKLIKFLEANPERMAEWARVLGLAADIKVVKEYIGKLHPVTLTRDTQVTNHAFKNGRAVGFQAILQAGTAVLVDKYGTPVTKCYCGNPLGTPPSYSNPKYSGPRWPAYTPSSITIIQSTTVIIDTFTLVDTTTGEPFTRPRGTDGSADSPSTPTTPSTPPPTTSPPATAPPTAPPDTTPSGPSAEEQAIAQVQQAASACYPFPAPIEDSNDPPNIFTSPGNDPSFFVLTADGVTVSGNQQTFVWHVDRATLAFTPQNELAQVASNHCSLLN
jgi:hypothetical protein